MERKAWFCPSCNKHHAPHVETCPAGSDPWGLGQLPRFTPYHPVSDPFGPCANCKGACNNAACPKRMKITCNNLPEATLGWSQAFPPVN